MMSAAYETRAVMTVMIFFLSYMQVFQMFDKIIHIPQTSAIEPLDNESVWKRPEKEDEMPMTYPPGI